MVALLLGVANLVGCGGNEEGDDNCPDPLTAYRDRDGDGHGDGEFSDSVVICRNPGGILPAGYTWLPGDCDEDDPSAYILMYPDRDGDGDGVDDDSQGVCSVRDLPGHSSMHYDCNDEDPNIRSYAIEQWFDGVDADCDGQEEPLDCDSEPETCECTTLEDSRSVRIDEPRTVEVDPTCVGQPDLIVVEVTGCEREECMPLAEFALVGNRGTEPFHGEAVLRLVLPTTDVVDMVTVDLDIEPGAAWWPLQFPSSYVGEMEVWIDTMDSAECDLSNNRLEVVLPSLASCL